MRASTNIVPPHSAVLFQNTFAEGSGGAVCIFAVEDNTNYENFIPNFSSGTRNNGVLDMKMLLLGSHEF